MRVSEVARVTGILAFFGGLLGGFVWLLTLNEAPTPFNATGEYLALLLLPGGAVLFAMSEVSYRREPRDPAPEPAEAAAPLPPPGATGADGAPAPSGPPGLLGDLRVAREEEGKAYEAFLYRARAALSYGDRTIRFLRSEVDTHRRRADGMKGVAETAVRALEEERTKRAALEGKVAALEQSNRELLEENAGLKRDAGIRENPEGFTDETLTRLQDEIRRLTSGRA